jgi:hypothetical protein
MRIPLYTDTNIHKRPVTVDKFHSDERIPEPMDPSAKHIQVQKITARQADPDIPAPKFFQWRRWPNTPQNFKRGVEKY